MHHSSIILSGQKWACVTISIRNDVASCLLWVSWYVDFLRAYFVRTLGKFCLRIASGPVWLRAWDPADLHGTVKGCLVRMLINYVVKLSFVIFYFRLTFTVRLTSFQKREWPIVRSEWSTRTVYIIATIWTIVGFVCFGTNKMSKEKKRKSKCRLATFGSDYIQLRKRSCFESAIDCRVIFWWNIDLAKAFIEVKLEHLSQTLHLY